MKRLLFIVVAVIYGLGMAAQTVRVCTGQVKTVFNATADEMTFTDGGTTLNIQGAAFAVADIDSVCISAGSVVDNTVSVTYSGTSATVVVAGNIAPLLTSTVSGANVALVQSEDLADEITYTLQGSSTAGSFYMGGKLKASLVLNGLSLTAPSDSAAIRINNGKRIAVTLVDGTTNSLADLSGGSQKGCFVVKGHTEFKGGGSLTLAGKTKHAFDGGEYVELKKTVGAITVTAAAKDGFHVGQYFEQKGGTLTINGTSDDCLQVEATDDDTDEQNGQIIISGGTLALTATAAGTKGLKCDSLLTVTDGTITITTTGGGTYDSTDGDVAGCAGIKVGGNADISGGTFTLKSTGAGGKGMNVDGDLNISGGTFTVTTTGKQYTYNRLSASPKGLRAEGNINISGGSITVTTSGGEGAEGIESKNVMTISDGEVIVTAYDDALNASNNITISGGKVFARGTNNDAIDSNGTLTITGGLVIALGATTPEGSFDCDENTFTITGGTLIGLGGDVSTPTSSTTTQPVLITQGITLSSNSTFAVGSSDGTAYFAFTVPVAFSSSKLIVSCPSFSTGNTVSITGAVTKTGGTSWQGYTDDATISGGSSLASVTLSSVVTNNGGGNSGGGPGGGGGGPGGGGGGGRF